MKVLVVFSAFFTSLLSVNGGQLATSEGEALWIATIDDDYDCKDMTVKINGMINGHRRRLGTSVGLFDSIDGGFDCFVHFSSPDTVLVDTIREMDGVVSVDPDEEVSLFEFWGRDRADQDDLPLDNNDYIPSYNGAGQCLYVIDTGILDTHVDFTGRAVIGADFINETPPTDNNGHGTHCASIAAGAMHGIAPATSVIKGVKVLSYGGSGSSAGVIKGIQWAVNDAAKMKKTCVLSLSLGGGKNKALDKAVVDAAKKHIVVVAAGNSNMDACSGSPSGASGKVITVGSTKKNDYRSSFSNYGKCVDIFGPGSDITAAYIGSDKATRVLSGTSMATPYIAGLALQALQKNGGDLDAAYDDLFASALGGKLKDIGGDSPNLLGRALSYTGPPTPPTVHPTMPPTMPDPTLCKKNPKTGMFDICFDFQASSFGTYPWKKVPMMHNIVKPKMDSDALMCNPSNDDFTGKFALVKRGSCLFMDKVKNCEKQGAVGVIIYNDVPTPIFPPAYYGNEKTNIPSCMISMSDGTKMIGNDDLMHWGVMTDGKPGSIPSVAPTGTPTKQPSASPTPRPTTRSPTKYPSASPTPRPTTRYPTMRPTKSPTITLRCDTTPTKDECIKRPKCNWDGFVCYIRAKYQK